MQSATTIEQVQEAVRREPRLRVSSGGSKPALSAGANLSLQGLCGVLEYDPGEFTFTALAGTPIVTVERLLAEHGQYLPFDPPWAEAGATLGGTVAAGLSGPGRYRYGGVRDFLVGVRLVNGEGRLIRGGGKVVKNAAGFDLPKLMVGSAGEFGVLVETTFKVFPRPAASASLAVDLPDLATAVETMSALARSPLDLTCLDLEPPARLWLRIAGSSEAIPKRLERVRQFLSARSALSANCAINDVADEEKVWRDVREFSWAPSNHGMVKVPLVPRQVPELERELVALRASVPRRYSVAGNLAWLAWPLEETPLDELERILQRLNRPALALTGNWPSPLLGPQNGEGFARRLLRALDPEGRFQRFPENGVAGKGSGFRVQDSGAGRDGMAE